MSEKDEALIKIAIDALRALQRGVSDRLGDSWQPIIDRIQRLPREMEEERNG